MLQEIPEDAELRQSWNELVQRSASPQVFYTYEWALAVQRAYGRTRRPLICLASDDTGSLCGIAALSTDASDNRVAFLCATTGDYCDFISTPECKGAFAISVLTELRKQGLDSFTLANLPADSSTLRELRKASAYTGYSLFARTAYKCAQVSLSDIERRPGQDKPLLPRGKMVRRFLSLMAREGPLRIDHARSWDAIEPILSQFTLAHVARFLFTGRISNLARPERRMFLKELGRLLSEPGWLTLTRMMSGNHVCAWHYGFQFQDSWFWYQPTFDSEIEKYSPGFCLLSKTVEEAAGNPTFRTVELGLGEEEYKNRFANQHRETLHVTLNTSSLRILREKTRYRMVRTIKTSPPLEKFLRSIADGTRRLREKFKRLGFVGGATQLIRRVTDAIMSRSEVMFFEANPTASVPFDTATLTPITLESLALALCQYVDDSSTCDYLLRSAARLREGRAKGFGLVDSTGTFLHLAWITNFHGFFLSELNAKVSAPSPDCVMLFDCWTPPSARGRGYYPVAVSLVAKRVQEEGRKAWIFSASRNVSSVKALRKTGFQYRYSLFRRRFVGLERVVGQTPTFDDSGRGGGGTTLNSAHRL